MSVYQKIKPDGDSLALALAGKALKGYLSAATARPGSQYIPNGDGTGTLIGPAAGYDEMGNPNGVAQWVGDTTPPGKPTGIGATSKWGILTCSWDGTLEGGIPADFAYVSVDVDGTEVAQLTGAGDVTQQGYENGAHIVVGFTAYDSARDRLGNLTPNASERVTVDVTISDERAEIDAKVDAAEEAANKAAQDAQEAWDKAEQQAAEVEQAVQAAKDAAAKADAASTGADSAIAAAQQAQKDARDAAGKANQVASDLSSTAADLSGKITDVTKTVTDQGTKIEGAVEDAGNALNQATELSQTVDGVKATAESALTTAQGTQETVTSLSATVEGVKADVTQATDTATDALSKATSVEATANGIKAELSTNYLSKTDASSTYATKASLTATSESLTASIESAATSADAAMQKATEVEATAGSISTKLSQVSTKLDSTAATASAAQTAAGKAQSAADSAQKDADAANSAVASTNTKVNTLTQTVDGMKQDISDVTETASDALSKATSVEATANGIKTDISKNYVSKTDAANTYATKASLSATAEGLQADISEVTTTAEGALNKANQLEVTAEGLRSDLTETTTTADSALKKANTTENTVNGMKQTLTATTNTANSALSKSTSLETTVNGIKTQVESVSKTASSALTQASAAQQDITGFKTTVSNTYETKKDADDAMAQEVLDRNSAITQKANQILSEVKSNYVDKATGQTYASKTYVDQREDAILQAVETEYQSKDGMSSYYTKTQIDQQNDQIELGVSQAISDIEIGGTNRALGTATAKSMTGNKTTNQCVDIYKLAGQLYDVIGHNEEFTVSFDTDASGTLAGTFRLQGNGRPGWGSFSSNYNMADSNGKHHVFTTKAKEDCSGIQIRMDNATGTLKISNLKVEKGNKPTDWSPAPEDTAKELSSLTVSLNGITGKVSDLEGNQSSFQQTINGFEGRLTTAEDNASSAKSTATTANNTANSAKTTATNAQNTANTANSTANAAKTNASTALSTANSAKTTATNAQNTANAAKKQVYHSASGKSGTGGYVRFATVKFTGTYMNRPLFFALSNRGQAQSNVWVQWSNSDNADPSLASIKADGDINVWAHKTGTSTWEIIAQKSEGWDTIYVNDYSNNNGSGCTVSWVNVQVSSVSGFTAATRLAGKRNSADIDNAAKTATNYISFSTNGLVVGTNSGGTGQTNLLGNTRLYSGGMEVRNGTTVLARYGASNVELGVNSRTSQISMCAGLLTFKGSTSNKAGIMTITAHKSSSDALAPKITLLADGEYDAGFRVEADEDTPWYNSGSKGTFFIDGSRVSIYNGIKGIPLSEAYSDLDLKNATNYDSSSKAKWRIRGGWCHLEGRVKCPSANTLIADLGWLLDDSAKPGGNRNFICFGNNTAGAATPQNVYMNSSGQLYSSFANQFVDLSGVMFAAKSIL